MEREIKQTKSFRLYNKTAQQLEAIAGYLDQQNLGYFKRVTTADAIQFLADSYYQQLLQDGKIEPIEEGSSK